MVKKLLKMWIMVMMLLILPMNHEGVLAAEKSSSKTQDVREYVVQSNASYTLKYEIDKEEKYVTITGYNGTAEGELIIPSEIEGYPVKVIGDEAFYECSGFSGALVIPEGVTSIGGWAFYGCSGFTGNLVIPEEVTSIGDCAFSGCSGFTGNLVIPEGVTSIEFCAFSECSGFDGNLVIPEGVTSIGGSAFEGCSGFTGNLVIPEGVTSIGDYAFSGCRGFTGNLVIPEGVTSIGGSAFEGCSGFTGNLVIPEGVTSIGGSAFEGCSEFTGNLVIPEGVTSIEYCAFYGCSGFDGNLVIPEGVTSIGGSAFYGCSGFTGNLVIPEGVTSIGDYAFSGCRGFTGNLVIPEGVTSIGEYAFEGCRGFTGNLVIPEGVTSIDGRAFKGCRGFTGNLVIPEGVTSIGGSAFEGCSGFTGNLVIPEGVTSIGGSAFKGCSGFDGNLVIPEGVTSIGGSAFEGCSGFTGNLVIPEGVTSIEFFAFYGCSGFTGNLVIPEGVMSIEYFAFYGCRGFTGNLVIPEGVTSIGEYAFYGCRGFTGNLVIPEGVTSIDDSAFEGCSEFTGNLVIPEGVTSIDDSAFGGCSGFTGNLVIPEGVTSIGDHAFDECSGFSGDLVIPEGVTSIGARAFDRCSGFTGNLLIPEGVTSIGEYAFSRCSGFTGNLVIPEGVTSIDDSAFEGCSGFKCVIIPRKIGLEYKMDDLFCWDSESSIECIYYGGTKAEWQQKNSNLNKEIIVFCSDGVLPEGAVSEQESPKSVKYFDRWDSENQIAYFGKNDFLGSRVTDETDLSFLENVENLVGKYVLVETKERTDDLVDADTLISITEVETKKGKVVSVGAGTLTIGDKKYEVADTSLLWLIRPDDTIVYHIQNEKIVGITTLQKETGVLKGYNSETKEVTITSESLTVYTYVLSDLADEETLELLGISGSKNISVQYVFDRQGLLYHIIIEKIDEEDYSWKLTDEWNFRNYTVKKIPLKQEDYNVLIRDLNNTQKEQLDSLINEEHNGQCYGMAVTSLLIKKDALSLDAISEGLKSLYDAKKNNDSKSKIGYYQLNQYTREAVAEVEIFQNLSLEQQLQKVNSTSVPYILSFGCSGLGAHAVVVTDIESGTWEYHGKLYTRRAVIYDSNYGGTSDKAEESYLYYNLKTLDWEIPNYYSNGVSSEKGYLKRVCNKNNVFNSTDIFEEKNEDTAWLRNCSGSGFKINSSDKSYSINSGSNEYDDLIIYYDIGYNIESPVEPTINVEFEKACEYTVIPNDEGVALDMSMLYPDYYMEASAETYESISLKQDGAISASGLEGTYNFSMTSNEDMGVLDCYKINLEGDCATEISMETTTEGILINADDLSNLKVTGVSSEDSVTLNISSDKQSVLVTENNNGNLSVLEDEDNDGVYEKDIYDEESKTQIYRISGTTRYETGIAVADELKTVLGVDKFDTVIIATGKNYADALSGSYLASVKKAPILLTNGKAENIAELHTYIKENVRSGATIYILGGTGAVPETVEAINGYKIVRLAGSTRYETNLAILEEAGYEGQDDLLVATGKSFADSLSASAVARPILLVKPDTCLTDAQKTIAANFMNIYVIGGTGAVSKITEEELSAYGIVTRLSGTSRYETSVAVAEAFFTDPEKVVLAYGKNFPDGLCGGALATALNAPLILTKEGNEDAAVAYVAANGIRSGYVLGGEGALPNGTVVTVFGLKGADEIIKH